MSKNAIFIQTEEGLRLRITREQSGSVRIDTQIVAAAVSPMARPGDRWVEDQHGTVHLPADHLREMIEVLSKFEKENDATKTKSPPDTPAGSR